MSAPVETLTGQPSPDARPPQRKASARQALSWFAALAIIFSALVGANAFGLRDDFFEPAAPKAALPAAGRVAGQTPAPAPATNTLPTAPTLLRSQPWWQDVTTLTGTGTTTSSAFTIVDGAVQWRVTGSCQSGRITVKTASSTRPVLDAACSGNLSGFGSRTGQMTLQVAADGPWKLTVAQQIDSPLVEPPAPAMTGPGAAAIRTGSFYNIDKTGTGKVTLYRQTDGTYALRLDDFFVSPNADLQLRLSSVDNPKSSQEYINGQSELVVVMDVTAGSFNYPVPAGVDPTRYKSVVVWCSPVASAYAAAPLGAVR